MAKVDRSDGETQGSARGIVVAMIIASAAFLELKDANALVIALPTLATDFGVQSLDLSLTITAYVVTLAVFIPMSGWVADRFGARRVFSVAMVVFLLGSSLCALSESLDQLVAARILQALGGSFMTPVGRLILLRSFPRGELVSLMAWFGFPMLIGPLASPLIGGALVDMASWHWIFWMNLPVGAVILILVARYVPDVPKGPRAAFDWRGWVPLSLGLFALMAGLEAIGAETSHVLIVVLLIATGIAALALYAFIAWRQPDPLIDVRLLKIPSFRAAITGGLAFRLGSNILPFLVPMLLQVVYGYDALTTGFVAAAAVVGALASRIVVVPIMKALTPLPFMICTALLAALAAMALAFIEAGGQIALLIAALLVGGFMRALHVTGLSAFAYAEIGDELTARATSFSSTMQQVGMALGIAAGAILVHVVRDSPTAPLTHGEFAFAFIVAGVLCAAAIPAYLRVPRTAVESLISKSAASAAQKT